MYCGGPGNFLPGSVHSLYGPGVYNYFTTNLQKLNQASKPVYEIPKNNHPPRNKKGIKFSQ